MKNPISILKEEHTLILKAIEIGRDIQNVNENNLYYKLIHDFILFIRNYTEIYHYPKEENILYPLLKNYSEKVSSEFIHSVADNHDDFRFMIAEIENLYVNHNYRELRLAISKYLDELEEHIKKENSTILKITPDIFSDKESEALYNAFVQLDNKQGEKEDLTKQFYKISMQLS